MIPSSPIQAPYSITSTPDGIHYIICDIGGTPEIFNSKTDRYEAEVLCMKLITNWMEAKSDELEL
jgi:hypothetical protein